MIVLRDWITPHLNFIPYLDKPPFLYWLTAVCYQLLGVSGFSARLVTALAAIAGVGVTYGIGRDLWGRNAGLASGLILATTLGYFIFSRTVLTDMLFSVLLAMALWAMGRGLLAESPRRGTMLCGYAAMALAVLTKGLIGLVFPVLTVGAFLLLTRDWRLFSRLDLGRGGALFLAIAAPWHIMAGLKHPDFFWLYFADEHFLRFTAQRPLADYSPMSLHAFLIMVIIWTLPWSVFLPVALWHYWPSAKAMSREERGFLFIVLWAASVIGFFALTPSRLEYYSMPAFPALALLVGRLWEGEIYSHAMRESARGLWLSCFLLLSIPVGLLPIPWFLEHLENGSTYTTLLGALDVQAREIQAGILYNAKVYSVPSIHELLPILQWATLTLLMGTGVATFAWLRRRKALTFGCLVATMLPILALVQSGIIMFEPHRSGVQLAEVIQREIRLGDQLIVEGPFEIFASVTFYTGQRARVLHGLFGDLKFASRYPEARGMFLEEEEFQRLWQGSGRVFLLSDSPNRLGKLQALGSEPVLLGRSGKNWLFSNRARSAE